ncbi:MAG: MerR family transcriptional regulator [Clostridia bacterium]|nr:MerR family transcriptional regulator [Clostridia bacterium]
MKTVHEVAALSGVSIRTLHYYDQIGLLPPSATTEAGYRLYDEEGLRRLQEILFLRELDFPLKEIAEMVSSPSFDRSGAVRGHRKLLALRRERLTGLIALCDRILEGETQMSFEEFDHTKEDQAKVQYREEVRSRWGETDSYKESERRAQSYGKEDIKKMEQESAEIFQAFGRLVGQNPASAPVQALVEKWRQHIDRYYYPCSMEMLKSLGQMYVGDERFTKNLDQYGEGTAKLMSEAIEACTAIPAL